MRLKSLSLQMVPWCFAAAWRPSSDADSDFSADEKPPPAPLPAPAPAPNNSIRVVGADGAVRVYDAPVSAAEVMTDNPCQLVCRADAGFTIGQKVPALSPADRLLPGHSYFLLPSHFFHSVLSFVSLASSLLLAGSTTASKVRPFRIRRSPTGALQIIVCDDGDDDDDDDRNFGNSNKSITKVEEDAYEKERRSGGGSRSRVCTDERLEKEYREMVKARTERRWTPKLETIGECEMERMRRGEGFLVFGFGRRRRWWWWKWKRGTTTQ